PFPLTYSPPPLPDALPIYVEHRVGVPRGLHMELDRSRGVQAVDRERGRARDAEGRPALPLGLPGIDREDLHERRERLVEPDAVPDRKSTRLNSSHQIISYA